MEMHGALGMDRGGFAGGCSQTFSAGRDEVPSPFGVVAHIVGQKRGAAPLEEFGSGQARLPA